jgi:hypothetical protein
LKAFSENWASGLSAYGACGGAVTENSYSNGVRQLQNFADEPKISINQNRNLTAVILYKLVLFIFSR